MYRLMIVDDESSIREGIIGSLDWAAMGFEIIGSFSDGYEVLECLEYQIPDVIITDIRMKQISGMDVARFVHAQGLPCKVVFISGFQEFELAVEGMKYGIVGYLCKPLSVSEIRETFQKLKTDLDKTQYQLERAEKEKAYLERMRSFLEKSFFEELVLGVLKDTDAIRSRMRLLLPDMDYPSIACLKMDMEILDFGGFIENHWEYGREQLEKSVRKFLQGYSTESAYYFLVSKNQGLLEILGLSPDFRNENVVYVQDALRNALSKEFQVELQCGNNHFYPDIFGAEQSVFLERNSGNVFSSIKERRILEQKKLLLSSAATGNAAKAKNILKTIQEESQDLPEEAAQKVFADILNDIHQLLVEVGRGSGSVPEMEALPWEQMTPHQITKYCVRFLDGIQAETRKGRYSGANILKNAMDYIERNIFRDISREEVAQQVFVSPSYLSRVFAEETGEGFLQYINRRKIEKSIDLLKDPTIKLYEISERMGYKTPRYYSRLFQAQMGMTPKEYRTQLLSQADTEERE